MEGAYLAYGKRAMARRRANSRERARALRMEHEDHLGKNHHRLRYPREGYHRLYEPFVR